MKRALFALALAAALPFSAQASELNYNYIELGYQTTDVAGVDFEGFDLNGSVAFSDNWYGFAGYAEGSNNIFDVDQSNIGVGVHTSGENAQWFGELSWVNVDFAGLDDDGFQLAGGVRGFLGEKFEGNIRVSYADIGDLEERTGFGVGGVFHINETWGITGGYDYYDYDSGIDTDTWSLGVRASF
jgi:hypothetical protein